MTFIIVTNSGLNQAGINYISAGLIHGLNWFKPEGGLKVVCRLALAIWSYWYGCRERIFLNISNAANPLETP